VRALALVMGERAVMALAQEASPAVWTELAVVERVVLEQAAVELAAAELAAMELAAMELAAMELARRKMAKVGRARTAGTEFRSRNNQQYPWAGSPAPSR
jgi:hypothetical protein